ncbi:MAG: hypothetical protein ACKV2Q_07530 [Planctomycetaceae bacterium]
MAAPDDNPSWTCAEIVAALRGTDDAAAEQALEYTRNRLLLRVLGGTPLSKPEASHPPGLIRDMVKVRQEVSKRLLEAEALDAVEKKVFTLTSLRAAAESFDASKGNWYVWVLQQVIWAMKSCVRDNSDEWQPIEAPWNEQTPSAPETVDEPPATDATSPAPNRVLLRFETALADLSDLQRGVWTLRHCRIREIQKLDLIAMQNVSRRTQAELNSLVKKLHEELDQEEEADRIRRTEKLGQDVGDEHDEKKPGQKKKKTDSFECKVAKLRYWQIRQRQLRDELFALRVPRSTIDEAQRAAELIESEEKVPKRERLEFSWAAPSLRDRIVEPWHQLLIASQKVGYLARQVENARREAQKSLKSPEPSHRRIAEILNLKDDKASEQALTRAKQELVVALKDLSRDSQQACD